MSGEEGILTKSSFYGNKNKRKCIGLENAINSFVKKHHREKIPKSFPSRILGPNTTWQTFFRQQEAFQFCRSTSKELHVIAFESGSFEKNTGQRLYLAASYPVFWHYYKQLDGDKRQHYEVIPEGAVCKLYFDLEYDRNMNPNSNGDLMVDLFIKYVCLAMKTVFNVACFRNDVLDLTASSEKKFSRHLIFQLKNIAFQDNKHAGKFVCHILNKLLEKVQLSNQRTIEKPLDVNTGTPSAENECTNDYNSDKTDGIIDINGVGIVEKKNPQHENGDSHHTVGEREESNNKSNHGNTENKHQHDEDKHRNNVDNSENQFEESVDNPRLDSQNDHNGDKTKAMEHGSDGSEVDKGNITRNSVVGKGSVGNDFKDVLASFEIEDLQSMIVKNKNGDETLFCDTGVYTKNRNFRLFLSSKMGKNNPLLVADQNMYSCHGNTEQQNEEKIFYDSLIANVQYSSNMQILTFDDGEDESSHVTNVFGRKKEKSSQESEYIDGFNKSPYPEVDEYIKTIIAGNSGKGVIRHWTYFHQGELLVYEIAKYRYCHNIGRHHSSNNIMLIADLQHGVWYQKCHDPDCHTQNYKSPEWPLPRDILPANYFDNDDDLDLEMDDDELLNTTLELEKQHMEHQAQGMSELDDGADDVLVAAVTELQANTNQENG